MGFYHTITRVLGAGFRKGLAMNVFILLGLGLIGFGVYQETTKKKGGAKVENQTPATPVTPVTPVNPVEQPKEK